MKQQQHESAWFTCEHQQIAGGLMHQKNTSEETWQGQVPKMTQRYSQIFLATTGHLKITSFHSHQHIQKTKSAIQMKISCK